MATAARRRGTCPVCLGQGQRRPTIGLQRGRLICCAVCGGAGRVSMGIRLYWTCPPPEKPDLHLVEREAVPVLPDDPPQAARPHRVHGFREGYRFRLGGAR